MKAKLLLTVCCMSFSLLASAQVSGGRINRNKVTSKKTSKASNLTIKNIDWSIVKSEDISLIQDDLNKASDYLSHLSSDASYIGERPYVQSLLSSDITNVNISELALLRKVRSIQVKSYGIFSYDYFNCRFINKDQTTFFKKTTGSQRKSGYLYRSDNNRLIFIGGWSVNDEPLSEYNSDNSVIGSLYKLSSGKVIMLFWEGNGFEIYEFSK